MPLFLLNFAQVQRLLLTKDITKLDLLSLSNLSLGTFSLRAFFSHFGQRAIHKTAKSKQARLYSKGMVRGRNFGTQFRPGATSD